MSSIAIITGATRELYRHSQSLSRGNCKVMRYCSVYLVVRDFEKSVAFYEQILDMKVSARRGQRFAMFNSSGMTLCIMNGYFDRDHSDEIQRKGEYIPVFDALDNIADCENTRKVFINIGVDDLRAEYDRIRQSNIANELTEIRFIQYSSPYWYFTFTDPDGNPIEITGGYTE